MKTLLILFIFMVSISQSYKAFAESVTCNVKQSSYNCLLCNCYHESRGEPFDDMVATAKVVLSRTEYKEYNSNICRVVYQPEQFSWTFDKHPNNISATKSEDVEGLKDCERAVDIAMDEGASGVLFYFNPATATSKWHYTLKDCGTIKGHKFMNPHDVPCPKKVGALGRSSGSKSNSTNKSNKGSR